METVFFRHTIISNICSGNLVRRVVVGCRNSTNWKQEVTSRGTRWGRCWQRQGWQGGSFNPVNLGSNKECYHYHCKIGSNHLRWLRSLSAPRQPRVRRGVGYSSSWVQHLGRLKWRRMKIFSEYLFSFLDRRKFSWDSLQSVGCRI